MQQHSGATLLPFFKKIQVLLFLYSREEKEGVVHRAVSGDSRTETEKSTCHETFLFALKKTNNGENVALSKCNTSHEPMLGMSTFLAMNLKSWWWIEQTQISSFHLFINKENLLFLQNRLPRTFNVMFYRLLQLHLFLFLLFSV